jgi:hypothetical protein
MYNDQPLNSIFITHNNPGSPCNVDQQQLAYPLESHSHHPFFWLPFSSLGRANVQCRELQASGMSWIHHNLLTQNHRLLPTCVILEMTLFHQVKLQPCQVSMKHHLLCKEPQCSWWADCTLPGQNWWPNKGRIFHLHLVRVRQNADLTQPVWWWGCSVAVWRKQQNIWKPWRNW